ncbi:MAG TPA: DUF2846 domain-containing protein [Pyrinomonadaceae bacterium]|jgi:hypothetical protein
MYRNLSFAFLFVLICALSSFAQEAQPTPEKQVSAKDQQKELRLKACGTEKVNYDAKTDKTDRPAPEQPADKALIYVVRTAMLGYKIHSKLAVDGKWMGVNRGNTHFYFTLDAGEHFFCSESENQDYLALKVEAGKTYYLKQQVEMGMFKARTNLTVLNEEEGKKAVAKTNLSVFELKK